MTKMEAEVIGIAGVFVEGGGGKPQILWNNSIRNFQNSNFFGSKGIVEWKIRSCGLLWHLTRILLQGDA